MLVAMLLVVSLQAIKKVALPLGGLQRPIRGGCSAQRIAAEELHSLSALLVRAVIQLPAANQALVTMRLIFSTRFKKFGERMFVKMISNHLSSVFKRVG